MASSIVVFGYGSWSTVAKLPTRGYSAAPAIEKIVHYHILAGPFTGYHDINGPTTKYHETVGGNCLHELEGAK